MLKAHGRDGRATIAGRGIVHSFVETAELRRLLSLLAGTELLGELLMALGVGVAASPAAEVALPPPLL